MLRKRLENAQKTPRKHSQNAQKTLRKRSENAQKTLRKRSAIISTLFVPEQKTHLVWTTVQNLFTKRKTPIFPPAQQILKQPENLPPFQSGMLFAPFWAQTRQVLRHDTTTLCLNSKVTFC